MAAVAAPVAEVAAGAPRRGSVQAAEADDAARHAAGKELRRRHSSYASRGSGAIRSRESQRRGDAARGGADLAFAQELFARLAVRVAEEQAWHAAAREAVRALTAAAERPGALSARGDGTGPSPAAVQLALLAQLQAVEEAAGEGGALSRLREERKAARAAAEEVDKRVDKSQERGQRAAAKRRAEQDPYRAGSPPPPPPPAQRGKGKGRAATTTPPRRHQSPLPRVAAYAGALTSTPASSPPATSPGRRVGGASARLRQPPRRPELPVIDRGPRLEKGRQAEIARRLCDDEMRARQKRSNAEEARAGDLLKTASNHKQLKQDEEEAMLQRMFYQQRDHEMKVFRDLATKWRKRPETKKMTAEQQKESNERMFFSRQNRRHEVREELRKKYIDDTNPTFPRMDAGKLGEAFKRLGGGA